jgi:hypothetical protein
MYNEEFGGIRRYKEIVYTCKEVTLIARNTDCNRGNV